MCKSRLVFIRLVTVTNLDPSAKNLKSSPSCQALSLAPYFLAIPFLSSWDWLDVFPGPSLLFNHHQQIPRFDSPGEQRGHRMFVSNDMKNAGFLLTATRKEPLVNSVLRHGGHGIFLGRGDRFASIDIAAPKKAVRRRNNEPHSLTPEQRRTLGSLGYCQVRPGSDRRNRRQQLSGFLASPVAARTAFRTMFVDSLRLPGNDAEQTTEIFHKPTPDLRRDPQAIEQRSKLFRRRTQLARSSLPSRPVQQGQVLRS